MVSITRSTQRLDLLASGFYSPFSYGALGDGIADDYQAIQDAIHAAEDDGGGTIVLGRNHLIGTGVEIIASNVFLKGLGGGRNHAIGDVFATVGTMLYWDGDQDGIMLHMYSPTGASAQLQDGGGVSGVCFRGRNISGVGLKITSWWGAKIDDIYLVEHRDAGLLTTVGAEIGDGTTVQGCTFTNIKSRFNTATGDVIRFDGVAGLGNTNGCYIRNLQCQFEDGNGLVFANSDNIEGVRLGFARASGGSGNAIVFEGAEDGGVARAHSLHHVSANAPIVARGTATYTNPSHSNFVGFLDKDNATPNPTIEAGATMGFSTSAGIYALPDGVTAPSTVTGGAQTYVDAADGDYKIKFGDGTVKVVAADT